MSLKKSLRTVVYNERLDFEYDLSKISNEFKAKMGNTDAELAKFAAKELCNKSISSFYFPKKKKKALTKPDQHCFFF